MNVLRPVAALIVALIVCCAGCQRDLTRSDAKALIAKSEQFTKQHDDYFPIGHVYSLIQHRYEEMQKAGYVKITRLGIGEGRVVLTSKGSDTVRQLGGIINSDLNYVSVPSGAQEVVAVTGVSIDGKAAVADFDWRWNFNELGAVLNPLDVGILRHGRAFLRLYDDGWRVVSIDFSK
ncbi:MAG: hypothetical protein ABSG52_00590 [Terriglobales bacterium]|jgi:hypothetical protein